MRILIYSFAAVLLTVILTVWALWPETPPQMVTLRDFEKKYGIEQAKKARDEYKKKKPKKESAKYAPEVEKEYKNLYYDEDSTARELQYRHLEEDEKAGKRYAEKIKKGQQSASYRRKAQIQKATEVARYDLVNYDELKKDYDNYVAALEAVHMLLHEQKPNILMTK